MSRHRLLRHDPLLIWDSSDTHLIPLHKYLSSLFFLCKARARFLVAHRAISNCDVHLPVVEDTRRNLAYPPCYYCCWQVGSAEGWTPSTFTSSRDKRAAPREQRPEDFMDDEDGLLTEQLQVRKAVMAYFFCCCGISPRVPKAVELYRAWRVA